MILITNIFMNPFRNKSLFFLLIAALLTAQWASAHIHLAEHHDHDGSHHQHASEGHSYHPSSQHLDIIDAPHAPERQDVVELEHECTSKGWNKLDDLPDVSISVIHQSVFSSRSTGIKLPSPDNHQSSWLNYSTVRLRAPPLITS